MSYRCTDYPKDIRKMANVVSSSEPKLEARLMMVLTEDEKQAIRVRAALNGKSMSAYVRSIIFFDEEPIGYPIDTPEGGTAPSDA